MNQNSACVPRGFLLQSSPFPTRMHVSQTASLRCASVALLGLLIMLATAFANAQTYTFATLAGEPSIGAADGIGSNARFFNPSGIAVDNSGNFYVADSLNNTIRKMTPNGFVSTLAGLAGSWGSTDGTGANARFNYPNGVAVDNAGNVYVADTVNNTIRKITADGDVTTIAGLARSTGSTDGTRANARFNYPSGVAVDNAGNVYVADSHNFTIRKITPGRE